MFFILVSIIYIFAKQVDAMKKIVFYCLLSFVFLCIIISSAPSTDSSIMAADPLPPTISTFIGIVSNVQFKEWEWDSRNLLTFQPIVVFEKSHIQGAPLRLPRIQTVLGHEEVILYSSYTGIVTNGFICARFIRPRSTPPSQ